MSSCRFQWRILLSGKVMQVPGGIQQTRQAWGGEQSGCLYSVRPQAIAFPVYADLLQRQSESISNGE